MRLPCEGSPDPAANGGVPELARVPRQGSAIGFLQVTFDNSIA